MNTAFIPGDVREIMARLHEAGFAVWLVGGALRDALRGEPPQDWDLATDATPQQITALFPRVIPIGIRHGTVQVHTAMRDIEVTSCQAPSRQGILQDLARRDFTINAIALGFPSQELLDPHGGQRDLQLAQLRAVGTPVERFREDPLRTLRAGRFMSVFGFKLHEATRAALRQAAVGLAQVAQERIRDEMAKLLMGKDFLAAMNCMHEAEVLCHVLPELLEQGCNGRTPDSLASLFQHTILTVHYAPFRQRVRLAALLHALGRPAELPFTNTRACCADYSRLSAERATSVMTRWRMSRKEISQTGKLIAKQLSWTTGKWTDADARRLIAAAGKDLLEDSFDLATADCLALSGSEEQLQNITILRGQVASQLQRSLPLHVADLAVNGNEVMRILGLKPGPWLGALLHELHQMVLEDPGLNEPQTLTEILRRKRSVHPKIVEN